MEKIETYIIYKLTILTLGYITYDNYLYYKMYLNYLKIDYHENISKII